MKQVLMKWAFTQTNLYLYIYIYQFLKKQLKYLIISMKQFEWIEMIKKKDNENENITFEN